MHIDLLSAQTFANGHPQEQYSWLREQAPVYWHTEPNGPGFWAVTRYDDVRAVGRNAEHFSSRPTIMIPDPAPGSGMDFGDHQMMLMMDPPRHTNFRKIISREFTRGPAAAFVPRATELARQIVDAVIKRGECDFVAEVAGEMPSFVIAELMGLPLEDGRKLYELTEIIHSTPESLPPGAQGAAVARMFEYAQQVIKEKRSRPGDDLATQILQAEVDGERLDDVDFMLFFLLLIDAGGDTTRNLVSAGLLALLEHPDQFARLRGNLDALLPTAREEMLRWTSPVIYMRRTAKQATVIGNQPISAGDKVVMYYGAANRDSARFAAADSFDVGRTPNEHLAFGQGPHICLGQHLARIEIDAILREVFTRMHDIALLETPEWLPSNFIAGPKRMPVRFSARQR